MLEEKHILIIDDEKRMADSLKALLETDGYAVDSAYSGAEGLGKVSHKEYHVVITDLRMAEVDGYAVMRHLEEQSPETLVIVITGYASTESAIEALHHKAFDYITKPFDFELLRASVENAFSRIETERLREDMIHMITHDIRIPLTSIIGYTSMIVDRRSGKFHPRAKEFAETISTNAQKILALIDNFLTCCTIEAGKLFIREGKVNLKATIEDVLSVLEGEVERCALTLHTELLSNPPTVLGDEHLLFRAICNLLSNAIKFAPRDGRIKIKMGVVRHPASPLGADALEIAISNSGPGIPRADIPQIFQKYKRLKDVSGPEGSGLGLYVVKHVIEAHRGRIEVDSIANELTTFTVYLPIAEH